VFELFDALHKFGPLGLGHAAHLGLGRGVGNDGIEVRQLGGCGAIGSDRSDHGLELGVLARELHEGLAGDTAR
jgi:hypothetical protein